MAEYLIGYVREPLPGDERFEGCISLPYKTPSGVRSIKFRSLTDTGSKYNQVRGQQTRLFNPAAFYCNGSTIGITEGEFDAIAASECLGVPSVGVPGATQWLDLWTPLFRDFSTVFVFADGDQPGRDFAAQVEDRIGLRARIVHCPDNEDVSSMIAQGREAELEKLISTSNGDDE